MKFKESEVMSLEGGIETYTFPGNLDSKRYLSNIPPYGRKVYYLQENGWDYDREVADRYFEKGQVLTVKEIYVGRSSSEVEFAERPNIRFNTVMFKDK